MSAPGSIDTDVRSADQADYEHYVRLVAQLALPADEPIPPAARPTDRRPSRSRGPMSRG